MTSALRHPRLPVWSRALQYLLAAFVVGIVPGKLLADDPAIVAAGKYSRGACQLRVLSVEQTRSEQSRNGFEVAMQFQLEFPQGEKQQFTAQLPAGIFLNNARTPLTNAEVDPGKNLAKNNHTYTAEGSNGVVTIGDVVVGQRRDRLRNVDIEVALLRVTDWEQKKFEGIGQGVTEFLQCGPFEFRVMGDPQQLRLSVWAYPQFKAEHEAYRKKMPLKFIGPDYALDQLKLTDHTSRSPTATGIAGGGAGASIATYTNWRGADGVTGAESDEVSYPVTLSVQLPARFEIEAVKFHFDQIPVPAPK